MSTGTVDVSITALVNIDKIVNIIENKIKDFANYKDENKKEKLLINLRNIFTRSQITEQELNTLYGIINYLSEK